MEHAGHIGAGNAGDAAGKIDAVAWGLFFIWIGIALIADLGWGVGLVGIGVITLGAQASRRYFGLSIDGFWTLVGVLFVLGGIWELLSIRFSIVPVVLIVAGIALLLSVITHRTAA